MRRALPRAHDGRARADRAKAAYREPFEPLPGRRHVRARTATRTRWPPRSTDETAAVVLEPIQGEAGVRRARRPATWQRPARSPPRTARCCGSTRCRPASAAPGRGSRTPRAASPRTWSRSPRAWPAASRSVRASRLGEAAARCSAPATTARPSAATRSPRPPRSRCSPRSSRTACSTTSPRSASCCAPALADPLVTEVRGRGLLIGLDLDAEVSAQVADAALRHGVIINPCTPDADPARAAAGAHRRAGRGVPRRCGRRSSTTATPLPSTGTGPRDPALPARRRPVARPSRPRCSTLAKRLKADRFAARPLEGPRAVAVIFDKPTLRTQVSVHRRHRRARRLPDADRRQPGPDRHPRVGRRHRPGARPAGRGRSCGGPSGRTGSRRWPRTPACRWSTRSPTTSTPARCSPTCRPSRSTRAASPA